MQHPEQIAAARGNITDLLMVRNGAIVVLIAEYVYALSFNFLPDGPRLAFAGGVLVLNGIMAIIAYTNRQNSTSTLILLAMLITCVSWGLSYGLGYGGGGKGYSFPSAAKHIGVYMIAIWVLAYPEIFPRRLLAFLAVATLIGGGGYATFAPRVDLAGEEFFAHITGVPESYSAKVAAGDIYLLVGARHSSATLIMLNIVLVDQLRQRQLLRPIFAWPLVIFGVYVIFGYWSRNNMVSLFIYFLATFYYSSRNGGLVGPVYFLLGGFFLLFSIGTVLFVDMNEIYYWGSGRIGTYIHRIDILSGRDFGSLIFGTGLGSDWFRSYTWWNTEKVSHSQFFSIIIEQGFLGIISFIIFMIAIYYRLPRGRAKALFYMVFISGFYGFGLASDSQIAVFLFAAMAVAIVSTEEPDARNLAKPQ